MTKNNELFTTMPVGQAVAKLAIPTVVSQIIVILYSLADTFFIGQIGDPNQIAALSITFPIYTLLTAVANLFGIGANSMIARSLGQNDEETAKKHHHSVSGAVLHLPQSWLFCLLYSCSRFCCSLERMSIRLDLRQIICSGYL